MNWMKYRWLYFLISAIIILPGIISLIRFGLKPAIDFTGGTLIEYRLDQPIDPQAFIQTFGQHALPINSIQNSGTNQYLFRFSPLETEQIATVNTLTQELTQSAANPLRVESVGPTLGKELLIKAVVGLLLAAGFILIYLARQFKNPRFGICAILAMFHDSLVVIGLFSVFGQLFGAEVDTLFITALLTILSFSVHDTVVVYDRIRELAKQYPNTEFTLLVNKAVTETLSRSLNNSLTIIFMLLALALLGGDTIRWFIITLLIGTISGTYSSTFTAAPLLVVWHNRRWKSKD